MAVIVAFIQKCQLLRLPKRNGELQNQGKDQRNEGGFKSCRQTSGDATANLAYELLGGRGGQTFTPIPRLTEGANRVLSSACTNAGAYPSASAFVEALRQSAGKMTTAAEPRHSILNPPPPPRQRPPTSPLVPWLIRAAVLVVIVGGVLGYYYGIYLPRERDRQHRADEAAAQQQAQQRLANEAAKAKAAAEAQAAADAARAKAEAQAAADAARAKADAEKAKAAAAVISQPVAVAPALTAPNPSTPAPQVAPSPTYIAPRSINPAVAPTSQGAEQNSTFTAMTVKGPQAGEPWENSLGMKFNPAGSDDVLCSVWDVRVQDFQAFVTATGYDATGGMYSVGSDGWKQRGDTWSRPGFAQMDDDPVVGVSWNDAKAFCQWLTTKERGEGRLASNQMYRLPSDEEWSRAVGLTEAAEGTPATKIGHLPVVYPWPPAFDSGNYAGIEAKDAKWPSNSSTIPAYDDGYPRTSHVGSFKANAYGLYDMGGNVWQWCGDNYDNEHDWKVLRGGSWANKEPEHLLLSFRDHEESDHRWDNIGFRPVLVISNSSENVGVVDASAVSTPNIPEGFTILNTSLSPDGQYGVLAPDWSHYDESRESQNTLIEVKTGRVLTALNADTWVEDAKGHRNHMSLNPHWSTDGSVLAWILDGKWSPRAFMLLKIQNGTIQWQLDVLKKAQDEILERTKAVIPLNFEAAITHSSGFALNLETPNDTFNLPLQCHVTLNSNPKAIATLPPEVNFETSIDATIDPQGSLTFSNFTVISPSASKTTASVGIKEPSALQNSVGTPLPGNPDAHFTLPALVHADWGTDYKAALAQANAQNKLVLLQFTGSDWCTYGQILEKEVVSTDSFKTFADKNYVSVLIDFPHDKPQSDAVKQQNHALAKQFNIAGYPTLLVITPVGKELGREVGYDPGSGPDPIIAKLESFK